MYIKILTPWIKRCSNFLVVSKTVNAVVSDDEYFPCDCEMAKVKQHWLSSQKKDSCGEAHNYVSYVIFVASFKGSGSGFPKLFLCESQGLRLEMLYFLQLGLSH